MGRVCSNCGIIDKWRLGKITWDDNGNYDHEIICTECGHIGHNKGNFTKVKEKRQGNK